MPDVYQNTAPVHQDDAPVIQGDAGATTPVPARTLAAIAGAAGELAANNVAGELDSCHRVGELSPNNVAGELED